jgi:hypothetical protein
MSTDEASTTVTGQQQPRREVRCRRGASQRQALRSSPFVVEFEHGINEKGQWSQDHLVLQMEDCASVFAVLCPECNHVSP